MRLTAFAICCALTAAAHAQVDPTQQAGTLALQCSRASQRAADMPPEERECLARLSAYIHGWNAGVRRGLRMAFILDEANMLTTKGAKDVANRAVAILPATECLRSSGISFKGFVEAFIAYVAADPKRNAQSYAEVLTSMIEDQICRN